MQNMEPQYPGSLNVTLECSGNFLMTYCPASSPEDEPPSSMGLYTAERGTRESYVLLHLRIKAAKANRPPVGLP